MDGELTARFEFNRIVVLDAAWPALMSEQVQRAVSLCLAVLTSQDVLRSTEVSRLQL